MNSTEFQPASKKIRLSEFIDMLKKIAAKESEDLPVYINDSEYGLNDNPYVEIQDIDTSTYQDRTSIERRIVIE